MSSQVVQIAAGALVVAAFAGSQLRLLDPLRATYLVANFVGTAVLTAVALQGEQFGLVLTNGVWAVVSVLGVVRLALSRPKRGRTSTAVTCVERLVAHRAAGVHHERTDELPGAVLLHLDLRDREPPRARTGDRARPRP